MSLDLLKERFSGKPITSQYEEQIEDKEQIIEKLEEETYDLSNQVLILEKEKNNILQELNKARYFEEGVFSIKEKDYINEIQSKENIIKEIKSEFNPLHEKIDEQKDRLSYKDDVIKKYANTNKELNEKINKLNYRLNSEKENSKGIISEIKSERKRTYQDYVNNLDAYENTLTSKNEIITSHKTKLNKSLNKLKEVKNIIDNLKFENEKNKNLKEELKNKEGHILNLNEEINSLSEEVKHFSSLSNENNILYEDEIKYKNNDMDKQKQKLKENIKKIKELNTKISNLESKNKESKKIISEKTSALSEFVVENSSLQNQLVKAENFQNIITNKKDKFEKSIKEKNNLKTFKLVNLLTNVSREKQGNEKLTWRNWLKIPENDYLLNLDEAIAKKIFNESNYLIEDINKSKMFGETITTIYGLEFNGLRQSLNTTFSEGVNTPTDRTYSWWMKSTVTGQNRGVFGYGLIQSEAFHLNWSGGKSLWYLSKGSGDRRFTYFNDTPAQDDGNWHHWMLFSDVDDATGAKLYVDGVDIGINGTPTDDGGDPDDHNQALTIGAFDISTTTNEHFEGSITNFAVFSVDITDRAVAHYNNGIPKDLSGESNLVGYWKMDENTGTTAKDSSGNGNDGAFDGDEPTWIAVMKASDAYIGGIQQREL